MLLFKLLGFTFMVVGFGLVYTARMIVKKLRLDEKVECDFAGELNEDELSKYKLDKAMVNLKMLGLLISVPGIIFIILAFK